jgi:uncharacterized protein (DUF885 family)
MRTIGVTAAMVVLTGCGQTRPEPSSWPKMAEEFVYTSLANSPVTATGAGYHVHNGVRLDAQIDDYSSAAIAKQRQWYLDFRQRLGRTVDPAHLTAEEQADFTLINDQLSLALLEMDTIQSYRHNPTLYVELAGNALYSPFVLHYAPEPERFGHIISRLRQIPRLLGQAKENLASSPEVWTRTARQENDGNIALVDSELRKACPANLAGDYGQAAGPAIEAMREFNKYLDQDLAHRPYEWRLGKDVYAQKFRAVLETDLTPEQALAEAEAEMTRTREEMLRISMPLYRKLHAKSTGKEDLNEVVSAVLAEIAKRHAAPDDYFADAKRDLDETRKFVLAKHLLTLPAHDNLQVIETPEFMRGIYSVGGFAPAPALEPQLGAFYWITPLSKDWPPQKIESKLKEYNYYGLKVLTIHEAMPGHYVQIEYANAVEPPLRRIVRSVFGNGPYIEGWAVYATGMMLDEGYLDHSPELRLTFLKHQLRVLANTILDVRLQTMGMTDQQAMDLMLKDTFQEQEEAAGKLQRAKLSSTQLPTYFAGWHGWRKIRSDYQKARGADFQLKEFHERALKEGAVSLPELAKLLGVAGK